MSKINSKDLKRFLDLFEQQSKTTILEEGKKTEEIEKIAKAKGIKLKGNTDLAGFKTVFTFANKANKNKIRLPKKKLLKALPSIIGKPVDIDHERDTVVGHYIDYRYQQKSDKVIAYGVFYKSNFSNKWERAKELFEEGKLTTSYEIWCPKNKRKKLKDGTFELNQMEIAGGALLFEEEPAFEDAEVLEVAKKKISEEDLIFASNYNSEEILTAGDFHNYADDIKKNHEEIIKEKEEKSTESEPKTKEETPKTYHKKEEKIEEPKEPETYEIQCKNCEKTNTFNVNEEQKECEKCKSIISKNGEVKYPPQNIDFKLVCPNPSCRQSAWLILDKSKEDEVKVKCKECNKSYNIKYKKEKTAKENIEKINFVYTTQQSCPQCGYTEEITAHSNAKDMLVECDKCGLRYTFKMPEKLTHKRIDEIKEIKEEKDTKEEVDKMKKDKQPEKEQEIKKTEEELKEKEEKQPEKEVKKEVETPKEKDVKEENSEKETKEVEEEEPKPNKSSIEKAEREKGKEAKQDKYYKTKTLRKAIAHKKELSSKIDELTALLTELKEYKDKYKSGILKTASNLISSKKKNEELEEKVKKIKENALKNAKVILDRREQLRTEKEDFSNNLSDEQILNDEKFENAKLKMENSLLKSSKEDEEDIVGSKDNSKNQDFYSKARQEIDKIALKQYEDKGDK